MSLGSPAKKAGKQWRDGSHFSESHHKRSKRNESRWRLVRAVRVRVGWLISGSSGAKQLLCGYVARAGRL